MSKILGAQQQEFSFFSACQKAFLNFGYSSAAMINLSYLLIITLVRLFFFCLLFVAFNWNLSSIYVWILHFFIEEGVILSLSLMLWFGLPNWDFFLCLSIYTLAKEKITNWQITEQNRTWRFVLEVENHFGSLTRRSKE